MQYLSNCSDAFDHTRGKASSLLLTGVGNIWLDGTVRVKHHLMFPRGRFVHEQSSWSSCLESIQQMIWRGRNVSSAWKLREAYLFKIVSKPLGGLWVGALRQNRWKLSLRTHHLKRNGNQDKDDLMPTNTLFVVCFVLTIRWLRQLHRQTAQMHSITQEAKQAHFFWRGLATSGFPLLTCCLPLSFISCKIFSSFDLAPADTSSPISSKLWLCLLEGKSLMFASVGTRANHVLEHFLDSKRR